LLLKVSSPTDNHKQQQPEQTTTAAAAAAAQRHGFGWAKAFTCRMVW
jgi:hypothetical protein